MTDFETPKEFRFKSGSSILNNIRQFSATEKAIFGVLIIVAGISAIIMAFKVNDSFMTEIPGDDGTLNEGLVGLPRTINPVLAATDVDHDISSLVYSGLMKYENGGIVPDLAKSYTVTPDSLTYNFTLRDNLHFQDGVPLTADDVLFTVQKIQDPAVKSPQKANWLGITAKVISPAQIQFDLKQPYSPFLSNATIGIIPKHIWSALNNDQFPLSQYNIEPIGSGPYKKNSIRRDSGGIPSSYSLSTWNGYYSAIPHISTITFNFFADEDKALDALNNGSIDSLPSVYSAAAARLVSDTAQPYRVLSAPLPRIFGVFFNQNQAPVLADKNVRTALDMVVDRNAIVKSALDGYGMPIHSPLPLDLQMPNVTDSSSTAVTNSTIATARALLEKNGWKRDSVSGVYQYQKKDAKNSTALAFDIYTADTPDLKQAAELVKKSWNSFGAQITVKIFDPSDLYQNVIRTRKYDTLLFGEFIGKDRDLYAFWHSSARNSPGLNVALYANSKVDKLLEEIRTVNDDRMRQSKYTQFAQLIDADIPAVFLYVPDFIYAVPKSMHNIKLGTVAVPSDRWNSEKDWYNTVEKVWKIFAKNN